MAELSPQAQAVLDAFSEADNGHWEDDTWHPADPEVQLAAALRALDSQLGHEILGVRGVDCSQIQLIADELEGADG